MILKDIAILASNTARTKAYLQVLLRAGLLPEICVVYTDDIEDMRFEAENYNSEEEKAEPYFDCGIPLLCTLDEMKIDYIVINNKDINSQEMENCITELPQKYLIYSGYGGFILKKHLFQLGKHYIHIHAGILPEYRGSTTAYYSILKEGFLGATAIFLSEGIDEGRIIAQETFDLPKERIDVDYIYEPYIRACLLRNVMQIYAQKGALESKDQKTEDAETYYIIHPVLKHLAMKKIEIKNG